MSEPKVYKKRPCKKCGVVFATQRCPSCLREAVRKWREENPEKTLAASRKWREENPEKEKAKSRKWYEKNPEKVKAKARKWYEGNQEKTLAASRKWREENPEKARAAVRKWEEENPEKIKARVRKYIETLSDGYVARRVGAPIKDLSPEIIELKREQLLMFRLNKELNATIQQLTKEVK